MTIGPKGSTAAPMSSNPLHRRMAVYLALSAIAIGILLRFVTASPLWLDEALTVNISSQPVGDLLVSVRNDGHPPLYYLLLHYWISLFGDGDLAARALSGLLGVGLIPLVWIAARRIGGNRAGAIAAVLASLTPFLVHYSTEARMYSLVSLLATAAWLVGVRAVEVSRPRDLALLAVLVSLLLWTHYWAIWLVMAAASILIAKVARARLSDDSSTGRPAALTLGALMAGSLSFTPWLPSLLFQQRHTGTPWLEPAGLVSALSEMAGTLGGFFSEEAMLFGWLLLAAAAVGPWLRSTSPWVWVLDLKAPGRTEGRALAVLVVGTLAYGWVLGFIFGAGFAGRYSAVVVPFVVVLAGAALAELQPRFVGMLVLAALLYLGAGGLELNAFASRTDARRNALAIMDAGEPGDVVVYCPDLSGPSTSRELDGEFVQVTFPDLQAPGLINWVDYRSRAAARPPGEFARSVEDLARGQSIFVVQSNAHNTDGAVCNEVLELLSRNREVQTLEVEGTAFDSASVVHLSEPQATDAG